MKSLKLKKLIAVAVVAVTMATISPIGASAEWKQDSKGWWNTEGSSWSTGWRAINGSWYNFGQDGYMKTGWVKDGSTWYYLQPSGAMKTGWVNDNGTWYYLASSGAMKTGWVNDGGTWYYLAQSGAMKTGWINDNGTWYFAATSGAMQTGVVKVDGKVYYLTASGAMATGTNVIDGVAYTFAATGEAIGDKIPTPTKVFTGNGVQETPSSTETPVTPGTNGSSGGGGSSHSSGSSSSNRLLDLNDGGTHTGDYTIYTGGTFGDASKVTTITGNVTISNSGALATDSITLRNLDINGTLTIDFGAGDVFLENVTVDGVVVTNVGSNSLHVEGNSAIGTLEVNDKDSAHIVVEGNASITNTTLLSGAELEVAEGATNANAFANVTISPASSTTPITLKGKFNKVEVDKPSDISLERGSIGTIWVDEGAAGAEIDFADGTAVTTLNIKATTTVTGKGTITTANIGAVAKLETKPANIAIVLGSGATITVGSGENTVTLTEDSEGVTIIDKVPDSTTDDTDDSISDFQKDINSEYADYAKVKITKISTNTTTGFVSFEVGFVNKVNNSEIEKDYVTQDILVTNADGTDQGVTYDNYVYTVKGDAKVYASARVYRDGQVGYVTTLQKVTAK